MSDQFLADTAKMLHVAAGIISDNAHVLYGGSGGYDTFVEQLEERSKACQKRAGDPGPGHFPLPEIRLT